MVEDIECGEDFWFGGQLCGTTNRPVDTFDFVDCGVTDGVIVVIGLAHFGGMD